jgi:hypothetical protein
MGNHFFHIIKYMEDELIIIYTCEHEGRLFDYTTCDNQNVPDFVLKIREKSLYI